MQSITFGTKREKYICYNTIGGTQNGVQLRENCFLKLLRPMITYLIEASNHSK